VTTSPAVSPPAIPRPLSRAPDELSLRLRRDGPRAAVAGTGELDAASAELLAVALEELRRGGHQLLRLELAGLTFCDLAGLRVLLRASRALAATGGQLVVLDPPGSLRLLLSLPEFGDELLVA
jgi:anti-anti-sigma factor